MTVNFNRTRARILALAIILLQCICFFPQAVSAVDGVSLYQEGATSVTQGDLNVSFIMKLASTQRSFSGITFEIGTAKGLEGAAFVSGPENLGANQSNSYYFTVNVSRTADTGIISLPITAYYNDGSKKTLAEGAALFNISRSSSSSSSGSYGTPIMDITYKLSSPAGLVAGDTTTLTITVANRGSVLIQDVRVALKLPDEMSINNGVALQYAGNLGVTESKSVAFPILTEKDAENKNYPIGVQISGISNGTASAEQTLYIPVAGGKEKEDEIPIELEILDISATERITAGEEATLNFKVKNAGKGEVGEWKVSVTPDQGLVNKTKNVFTDTKIMPGETKTYSVTYITSKELAEKTYLMQITAEAGKEGKTVSFSQYGSVFVAKAAEDEKPAKGTPQLIVSSYDYGGESVKAGSEFPLNISFSNTSAKNLKNVKVSLNADAGAFIPVGSSNSFYIGDVRGRETVTRRMELAVSPTAEQKTTGITVAMYYEDEDGGSFNMSDIISIPVVQETSLTVDDIIGPPELYVGNQAGFDVRFYNTGKTVLANLRITAEGNFDLVDSASYYAGNMASGASDSYYLNIMPRTEGALDGMVVFTFDDPAGKQQRMEKEFSFNVIAMPEFVDNFGPAPEGETTEAWWLMPAIIGGGVLLLIIFALILRRILKKRKMRRELALDAEYEDSNIAYEPMHMPPGQTPDQIPEQAAPNATGDPRNGDSI